MLPCYGVYCKCETCEGVADIWEGVIIWFKKTQPTKKTLPLQGVMCKL